MARVRVPLRERRGNGEMLGNGASGRLYAVPHGGRRLYIFGCVSSCLPGGRENTRTAWRVALRTLLHWLPWFRDVFVFSKSSQ